MAKIKHIALVTLDPERLAKFYEDVFEMKVLHRSPTGGVYITDGYMNIALLPQKAEGKPNGINHFGFEVEDQAEIARRMEKFGMKKPADRPADRPYAETRGTDPEGNNFDISVHGFQTVELKSEREARSKNREKAPA